MTGPTHAANRHSLLRELRRLGTGPDARFDTLLRLAARSLQCPAVWLGLIGEDESLWLKCETGLPRTTVPAVGAGLLNALEQSDLVATDAAGQAMGCRIEVRGQLVGLLCVHWAEPFAPSDDTRTLLSDFARLAADLLDARLNEDAWRVHAERLRVASLSASDWLWETDAEGRVKWVSSGVELHTGHAPSALIGLTMRDINVPVEGDDSLERLQAARNHREPFRDILAHRDTPKGRITVSMSGVPANDEHGHFCGYRGTTSNVTERVQARLAAQAAERLLAEALDSLTAGVMITDRDGRVMRANPVWRRSLGAYMDGAATWPEVVRNMALAGLYPDAHDVDAFVRWRLSLATPQDQAHELRWKDGWALVSDRLLPDGHVVHLSVDITEHKRAQLALAQQQAQLRDSQDQLRAVLDAVPDLWFVLDGDGRYIECSSPSHPMLAHPWERLRGGPFGTGIPKPLAQRVLGALRQALATGQVQRIDYDLPSADGVTRVFEARLSPMPGNRVLYVTRDLTELRNLEREVLVMQRAIEAEASLSICVVDATHPDMPLIYVNPAFERLTGYSRAESLGRNCRFLQGHLTRQPGSAVLREALREGRSASVTLTNVRKDGTVFDNAVHVSPVRDANGHLTHYIGVQRDATEQTRAADKLRLSEELYRSVATAISDGLLVVAPTLSVIAVNPAGCDILGVQQAEIVNQGGAWPFELLTADQAPIGGTDHPVVRVLRDDTPVMNEVHALRRADGELRWLSLSAHPLQLWPDSETFAVVLTFRDITRSRQAEAALREKHAAEMASRAKSEFLSRMSHEMRTPLNAVIGFTQLLQLNPDRLDPATVREYTGHVLDAGAHLLALIDDVLDLQKIEEGSLSLQLGPLDLHAAVTGATELLIPAAQSRHVRFDNQVPPGSWVQADAQRLRQVLLNIASNAVKYNHPGGTVRWRLEPADAHRVALCVEDTGAGMSPEQMRRLFQPFERLGRETSTIEGTGLGLIIARSLTQAIGGRLSVQSQAGHGTCVRVDLQAVAAPAQAPLPDEARPAQAVDGGSLRMLYVEDNRINAILFEEAMRMHGDRIELRLAEDGEQALDLARDWQPEVLVLDAHLPGMSGFEVLRLLRTLPGLDNVPAYMCSADAMPEDVQRAYEAGFAGYWAKPINLSAVIADIEQCLQRARGSVPTANER